MTGQKQKAGDNSTNIQAETLTVHLGPSVTEVRQIALDVFRASFVQLADEAKDVAQQRAEEVTEAFLTQLMREHAKGLEQAQDPDFQYALFTVQKEYARCGDKDLGDLLVDLLVDRTKQKSRSIQQIVLNESLSVAPKLTSDQLAALSVIFLFKYTTNGGIWNHQTLWDYLDRHVEPFADLITDKRTSYQHLEYCGCGKLGGADVDLRDALVRQYGALFSRGFDDARVKEQQLNILLGHQMFVPCINDNTLCQVRGMNKEAILLECQRLGVSDDDARKLVNLHEDALMSLYEVYTRIIDARPYMRRVFEVWGKAKMGRFTLTTVGIAIGHANVKKNVGEFTDLSIWIN